MNENNELDNRNILLYLLIHFSWSWLFWLPGILHVSNIISNPILVNICNVLAAFGPFVSAFTVTYLKDKKEGVKQLWKRGWIFKMGWKWYVPTLFLIPAMMGICFLFAIIIEGNVPDLMITSEPWMIIILIIVLFFVGGPLPEEFGWSGYFLEGIQKKWNALISSIIIGTLRTIWHVPIIYIAEGGQMPGWDYWGVSLITWIASQIIITWIYNNTERNIFAVMVNHTSANISPFLFPIGDTLLGGIFMDISISVFAILLVVIFGAKTLIREKNSSDTS